jgi:hypothetical protein
LSKHLILLIASFLAEPAFAQDFQHPQLIDEFRGSNELKRQGLINEAVGKLLSGRGTISEVEECGFWDATHCRSGYMMLLDDGESQAVLYFPADRLEELYEANPGARYDFEDCRILAIEDWGFNQAVFCQM